jgi:uncharacterized protein YkwD
MRHSADDNALMLISPRTSPAPLVVIVPLALAVAGAAALGSWPSPCAGGQNVKPGSEANRGNLLDPEQVTEELLALHNRIRSTENLGRLEMSKKLQAAAQEHARDMADRHKMTHTGSDGSTPSSRISDQGYRMRRCAENIAFGPKTCEAVVKGWMNSPKHRANVLGNFTQIGAACAIAPDGTPFWCVTFGFPTRRK